jgi:hypothetical protein
MHIIVSLAIRFHLRIHSKSQKLSSYHTGLWCINRVEQSLCYLANLL